MDLQREHEKLSYRKTNDAPVGNIALAFLKAYGIEKKYYAARAKQLWFDLMGPAISTYTENIYVKNSRLFVNITSSALKQELSFSKEKIITMINEEIGADFLTDVVIW